MADQEAMAYNNRNIRGRLMPRQRGDPNISTLTRMIDAKFAEEESLYGGGDNDEADFVATPQVAQKKYEREANDSAGSRPRHDPFQRPDSMETVAVASQTITIGDLVHPWGMVDYDKLIEYVEANPLDSARAGVLLVGKDYCRFLLYEQVHFLQHEQQPVDPKIIFGRVPLVDDDKFFNKDRYVIYYRMTMQDVRIRLFNNAPPDIYDMCRIWDQGKDIYQFRNGALSDLVGASIDVGETLRFPYIDVPEFCLEPLRHDPPGLQLALVCLSMNFMSRVTFSLMDEKMTRDAAMAKERHDNIMKMRMWRHIIEHASHKIWSSYNMGFVREDFIKKMYINGAVSELLDLGTGMDREMHWANFKRSTFYRYDSSSESESHYSRDPDGESKDEQAGDGDELSDAEQDEQDVSMGSAKEENPSHTTGDAGSSDAMEDIQAEVTGSPTGDNAHAGEDASFSEIIDGSHTDLKSANAENKIQPDTEAFNRVKERFDRVFEKPSVKEVASWQTEGSWSTYSGSSEKGQDEELPAKDIPIYRSAPIDIPQRDQATVIYRGTPIVEATAKENAAKEGRVEKDSSKTATEAGTTSTESDGKDTPTHSATEDNKTSVVHRGTLIKRVKVARGARVCTVRPRFLRRAVKRKTVVIVDPKTGVHEKLDVRADDDVTAGNNRNDNDDYDPFNDDWPNQPPITTLSELLQCLLDFVDEFPQMDNALNRIKCRGIFTEMGVELVEGRGRKPQVAQHPYSRVLRSDEEHAKDLEEVQFDLEDPDPDEIE